MNVEVVIKVDCHRRRHRRHRRHCRRRRRRRRFYSGLKDVKPGVYLTFSRLWSLPWKRGAARPRRLLHRKYSFLHVSEIR